MCEDTSGGLVFFASDFPAVLHFNRERRYLMKKRILSLLLTFLLAVSLFPFSAFAFGEGVLGGIPVTADPGSSSTGWTEKDGMLQTLNQGKSYTTSTLTLTFTEDACISFQYKASTEESYDKLTIALNGSTKATASGDSGWKGMTIEAAAGDKLTFSYKKDGSGNGNDDTCYLKSFSLKESVLITFHANNGTEETAVQKVYGKAALKPNAFTKDHGLFAGWALTADGAKAYDDGETIEKPESNLDLYALWTHAWELTFTDSQTRLVKDNQPGGEAPVPVKTGYSFGGWFKGETPYDPAAPVTEDAVYTAKWTANTYSIVFDGNGGEGEAPAPLSAVYDQDVVLPQNPFIKSGYKCLGWSTEKNAETAQYALGQTVQNLASNQGDIVTLYAVWAGSTVKVTVDLNYETENRLTTRDCVVGYNYNYVEIDGKATYQRLSDPVREGWLFQGWFDAPTGGNEITTSYKFASVDPVTLYAHWAEAVTITFDAGEGSCYTKTKTIEKGGTLGYLPSASLSGQAFEGWFTAQEGGEKIAKDTIFTESCTLYARYRSYQVTITFKPNGGTGAMDPFSIPVGETQNLPLNTFTREGYVFTKWSTTSSGSYGTSYTDGAPYFAEDEDYWGDPVTSDSSVTLYAQWQERSFEAVFRAIEKTLPENNIVRTAGALNLLSEIDTGYTIAYVSGDASHIANDGTVLALPESGVLEVTLTATVTDTLLGGSQSRTYTLTLYSQEAIDTEAALKEAAQALIASNYQPKFGEDTSLIAMAEKRLREKGYEGLTVTVVTPASDYSNYSGIESDGTIRYYYNPSMTGSSGYVRVQLAVHKDGVTALPDSTAYVVIPWDLDKALAVLKEKADNVTLPTEVTAEDTLYLPQHPYKEGVTGETASGYSDYYTWATVRWSSSVEDSILIGSAPSYPYYSPYAVTILEKAADTEVTLTAVFSCNNVNVSFSRVYTVTVKGNGTDPAEALRQELQAKLDAAMADPGVRDFVTREKADLANVTGDLSFPGTRDIGIDGSKQPITLTASDADLAVTGSNNNTRVQIYRPLPEEGPKDVDITITVTDKATGVTASATVTVTVQPLSEEDLSRELALMEQVKAHYFDGIKGDNTDPNAITENLHAFQEVYGRDGQLIWVYSYSNKTGTGIIPVDMDGWYESESWRVFRSSNPSVIHHENLLVERQKEHTTVTITSWLSSETYAKYAERYPNDSRFAALYKQPVSATVKVLGTDPTPGIEEPEEKTISVTFKLKDNGSTWLSRSLTGLEEGTTAMEAAKKALAGSGYSLVGGSYISGVRRPNGSVLSEKDRGENSGWMYSVNGSTPGVYMNAYVLKDGDALVLFYTDDYTGGAGTTEEEGEGTDTEGIDIYKLTGDYLESLGEEALGKYGAEWEIIGLARSGRTVPESYYAAVEAYVQGHILEGEKLDKNRVTENARVILALTALRKNPADVGGHNLLTPLGDADFVQKQGLNGIVYALLALDAGNYDIPAAPEGKEALTRETLLSLLLERQLEDGGWAFSGTQADADMTAMVLQALSPYKEEEAVKAAVEKALACLSNLQQETGVFASNGQNNCESTAQVIIALTALGIDPQTDSRFVKGGGSAYEALCRFYVEGGGFAHTLGAERNELATEQGYLALTAYHRFLAQKEAEKQNAQAPASLWDMTDVK